MVTIDDVYNRISSGTPAVSHQINPQSSPVPTMRTLQEIYDIVPAGGLTTASEDDVANGKTFIKRQNGMMAFSTGTFTISTNYYLPDTGQTQNYTSTFGEDNDYQSAQTQPSYTDNGNGTITDNRTGLMWVKDGNSAGCNNGGRLTWDSALTFCENLSYAGWTDWRLPNIRELESIVNAQNYNPSINTTLLQASNIDPQNDGSKYTYGENIGWMNWKATGAQATILSEYFYGYVWCENIGWICFASTSPYSFSLKTIPGYDNIIPTGTPTVPIDTGQYSTSVLTFSWAIGSRPDDKVCAYRSGLRYKDKDL